MKSISVPISYHCPIFEVNIKYQWFSLDQVDTLFKILQLLFFTLHNCRWIKENEIIMRLPNLNRLLRQADFQLQKRD